jgi:hypothetical protein
MPVSRQVTRLVRSGLNTTQRFLGNPTFVWKDQTFNCIPNTVNDSIKSENKSFNEDADFRMTVMLNQFSQNIYPELNDYIYYLGYQFMVKEIKKPGHGIYWIFVCENTKVNG